LNTQGAATVAAPKATKEAIMNFKTFAAVAVALAGAFGAGLAQARNDVHWSLSLDLPLPPLPFVVVRPAPTYPAYPAYPQAPVYEQPAPVYVQPAPVYYENSGYGRPVPVFTRPHATRWDVDGDGIPNRYDRHDNRYDNRYEHRYEHRGNDRDHGARDERRADPRWGR
jgi:hypothetical protein